MVEDTNALGLLVLDTGLLVLDTGLLVVLETNEGLVGLPLGLEVTEDDCCDGGGGGGGGNNSSKYSGSSSKIGKRLDKALGLLVVLEI